MPQPDSSIIMQFFPGRDQIDFREKVVCNTLCIKINHRLLNPGSCRSSRYIRTRNKGQKDDSRLGIKLIKTHDAEPENISLLNCHRELHKAIAQESGTDNQHMKVIGLRNYGS